MQARPEAGTSRGQTADGSSAGLPQAAEGTEGKLALQTEPPQSSGNTNVAQCGGGVSCPWSQTSLSRTDTCIHLWTTRVFSPSSTLRPVSTQVGAEAAPSALAGASLHPGVHAPGGGLVHRTPVAWGSGGGCRPSCRLAGTAPHCSGLATHARSASRRERGSAL